MNYKFLEINTNEMENFLIANGKENENRSQNMMIEKQPKCTRKEKIYQNSFLFFFFVNKIFRPDLV